MMLRKANILKLCRSDWSNLFTFSKAGIILKKGYVSVNLNTLEPEQAINLLDELLDGELTYTQRLDVNEVKDEFIEILRNLD